MTDTTMDRLRAADPAASVDRTPDDQLLTALVAEPRRRPVARRARVPRLRLAMAGAGVAAALIASVGLLAGGGGPGPDLAAQAYAQTEAGDDLLYVRIRTSSRYEFDRGEAPPVIDESSSVTERWSHRGRGRLHATFERRGESAWSDQVLRPDGSVHFRNSDGQSVVTTDADGPDARSWRQNLESDFVSQFRKRYEAGQLEEDGTATFDGRPAQRYVVVRKDRAPAGAPGGPAVGESREEYYVDPGDGRPLGSIRISSSTVRGRTSHGRTVEVVEALESREPTPGNLAELEFRAP